MTDQSACRALDNISLDELKELIRTARIIWERIAFDVLHETAKPRKSALIASIIIAFQSNKAPKVSPRVAAVFSNYALAPVIIKVLFPYFAEEGY